MAIIGGSSSWSGLDHNKQIVSGYEDTGSSFVGVGTELDFIQPPVAGHTFGKACVSTCGSRIVVEVHPDSNNLYESYLAFYDSETLQPIGLGTTNPGKNSILRFEINRGGYNGRYKGINLGYKTAEFIADERQVTGYHTPRNSNYSDDGYFNLVGITSYSARTYDVGCPDQNGGEHSNYSSNPTQYGFGGITPVDAGPTIPTTTGYHQASLKRWLRPHGYFDFTQYQRGELGWAPMNYETVVHSPVPLRDKIAAIVEYKIPVEKPSGTSAVAWGSHGYGRYNSTAASHLGMVCLGVFGLDGEVIAIHDIKFKSPSKMNISSDWWKVQRTNLYEWKGANNMPQAYETRMVSMGEYGCIKLSAHNGMIGIGCTFNQAHMYDTGTFDIYGPGDGVYLFRMGDSRLAGPRYFTNLRMPQGSYMDFFPEHLDMGSNYIAATGVPRIGAGATSSLFDQSTGARQSFEFRVRSLTPTMEKNDNMSLEPDPSTDRIGYGISFVMESSNYDNTSNSAPYFTGVNTSPHSSGSYVRLYDMYGLLQAHIGDGSVTDNLSSATSGGYPITNYTTKVSHKSLSGTNSDITVNYKIINSISIGNGKLVVGIASAYNDAGMIDVYNLRSTANIYPNMRPFLDEDLLHGSTTMYQEIPGFNIGKDRFINDRSSSSTKPKYAIDAGISTHYMGDGGGEKFGQNAFVNSQRIVIGSPDGDTLFNDGNNLSIKYDDSGLVEATNFDLSSYYNPYWTNGSFGYGRQYDEDDEDFNNVDPNSNHQYLLDTKGVLAGYARTSGRFEAKDFRSGVLIVGSEIGTTPAKIKILLTPPQASVLDILGEK